MLGSTPRVGHYWNKGWSQPATTNALVQDEAVSSHFGDEPKTHPLPLPRDFSGPFSAPKISPPTYFPPAFLPTSPLLVPSPHFPLTLFPKLGRALNLEQHKASRRCETQGLKKVESFMLKECGEEKARGALHPKCKSERYRPSLFCIFFLLYDFFSLCVFFFFLLLEKKKMPKRKCLKWKGRNKSPEAGAKSERAEWELEGKLLPFFAFFFLLYDFFSLFFFSFLLLENKKMPKESFWNKRAIVGM